MLPLTTEDGTTLVQLAGAPGGAAHRQGDQAQKTPRLRGFKTPDTLAEELCSPSVTTQQALQGQLETAGSILLLSVVSSLRDNGLSTVFGRNYHTQIRQALRVRRKPLKVRESLFHLPVGFFF